MLVCLLERAGGWCHFGCHEGGKRCVATTWLQDAARNGTVILSSVRAERLLFSPLASPQRGRAQKVAGVVGVLDTGGHPMYAAAPRRVIVRAPLVVVACGRSVHVLLQFLLMKAGHSCQGLTVHCQNRFYANHALRDSRAPERSVCSVRLTCALLCI